MDRLDKAREIAHAAIIDTMNADGSTGLAAHIVIERLHQQGFISTEAEPQIRWTCTYCECTFDTGDLDQDQPDGRYVCPICTDMETHLVAVPVGDSAYLLGRTD